MLNQILRTLKSLIYAYRKMKGNNKTEDLGLGYVITQMKHVSKDF